METGVSKAVELSAQYGVTTVVLFIVVFYLGGLVWYIIRQGYQREKEQTAREKDQAVRNEKREERLASLIEIHLANNEQKSNERHLSHLIALGKLEEADRRQREEHEEILRCQKDTQKQHEYLIRIMSGILDRLNCKVEVPTP